MSSPAARAPRKLAVLAWPATTQTLRRTVRSSSSEGPEERSFSTMPSALPSPRKKTVATSLFRAGAVEECRHGKLDHLGTEGLAEVAEDVRGVGDAAATRVACAIELNKSVVIGGFWLGVSAHRAQCRPPRPGQ